MAAHRTRAKVPMPNHHARRRLDGRRRGVVGSVWSRPMRARGGAMAASEPGLGTRILGDRWSVADGTPKPAWVQIEEQLADRIEAGALAPGDRLPPERDLAAGARREPDDRAPGARLARRARPRRARRRPRDVRARGRAGRPRPHARRRASPRRSRARAWRPARGSCPPAPAPPRTAPRAPSASRPGRDGAADRAGPARRRRAADARGHLRSRPRSSRACSTATSAGRSTR